MFLTINVRCLPNLIKNIEILFSTVYLCQFINKDIPKKNNEVKFKLFFNTQIFKYCKNVSLIPGIVVVILPCNVSMSYYNTSSFF